jgi:hypothetical protein
MVSRAQLHLCPTPTAGLLPLPCPTGFRIIIDPNTGTKLSEYAVQDKQQVADIDPSMIVDEEDYALEDDGSYDACLVCNEFGDAGSLMYCHCCEQLCHVFCAGLDRMPTRGAWYCQTCMENGLVESASLRRPATLGPAAWINGRSRVPRHNQAPDEWVGVWQSVWSRLQFDIEFPFEDDEYSEHQSDVAQRGQHGWDRRFALARQAGAGSHLQDVVDNLHSHRRGSNRSSRPTNRTLHREPSKTPRDPESQEEIRAWNQFEKAREQLAQEEGQAAPSTTSTSSRRGGHKRKAVDSPASPADSEPRQQQPERKLKRPRTRLLADSGESSSAAARRTTSNHYAAPVMASSPPAEPSVGPGFLQSLLQEVEINRFEEREKEIIAPQPRRVIVERACSPQNLSPGLSPVYQQPPRAGMSTPPPLSLSRSKSPVQQEQQLSPTYSPYSPADGERPGRRNTIPHRAAGLSSPPRSKDSSPSRPTLSYSTKAELQRMVTAVLKPRYLKKEVTKEQYTHINRDVSRLLYEMVGEAGANALVDQDTRERWQQTADTEVDKVVQTLRVAGATALSPAAEDSASSSS